VIVNPHYCPDEKDLFSLEMNLRSQVETGKTLLSKSERTAISERIAEEAIRVLLAPLGERAKDANAKRLNQPGYDFTIDDNIRIQVKGNTFVECVQWSHKGSSPYDADLEYDVLIAVDIGIVLRKDFGRLKRYNLPKMDTVDFYIVPNEVVRKYLPTARKTKAGTFLYRYHRPLNINTKEYKNQFFQMSEYKNRFDLLNTILVV
jgi:hypothetical protein